MHLLYIICRNSFCINKKIKIIPLIDHIHDKSDKRNFSQNNILLYDIVVNKGTVLDTYIKKIDIAIAAAK